MPFTPCNTRDRRISRTSNEYYYNIFHFEPLNNGLKKKKKQKKTTKQACVDQIKYGYRKFLPWCIIVKNLVLPRKMKRKSERRERERTRKFTMLIYMFSRIKKHVS